MQDKNTAIKALVLGTQSIPLDAAVANVLNEKGALTKASAYLCEKAGVSPIKGEKMKDLKVRIGADKAKGILATFNANKLAFHVWSAKVDALSAADPTMRKTVRVVSGKHGVIGINVQKRFVADAGVSMVVAAENAQLKARIAALEAAALALPA